MGVSSEVLQTATLWLDPARAGFAQPSDWQAWAARQLEKHEQPPSWLFDVLVAGNQSELAEALCRAGSPPLGSGIAIIGYALMKSWQMGEDPRTVMKECVDIADAYETEVSVEAIGSLQDHLNVSGLVGPDAWRYVFSELGDCCAHAFRDWTLLCRA